MSTGGRWLHLACRVLLAVSSLPAFSGRHPGPHEADHEVYPRMRDMDTLSQADKVLMLFRHNKWRSQVVPMASNMLKLYWSYQLEEAAEIWASSCKWGHGQPDVTGIIKKSYGQNIYTGNDGVDVIVDTWGSEAVDYEYRSGRCTRICAHYTQLIWANTMYIGCGASFCHSLNEKRYVVCYYYPEGNWAGQRPYETGAPCSRCPNYAVECGIKMCKRQKCPPPEKKCTVDNETCLCTALSLIAALAERPTRSRLAVVLSTSLSIIVVQYSWCSV